MGVFGWFWHLHFVQVLYFTFSPTNLNLSSPCTRQKLLESIDYIYLSYQYVTNIQSRWFKYFMVQKVGYQSLAWVIVLNVSACVGLSGTHSFDVSFPKESAAPWCKTGQISCTLWLHLSWLYFTTFSSEVYLSLTFDKTFMYVF